MCHNTLTFLPKNYRLAYKILDFFVGIKTTKWEVSLHLLILHPLFKIIYTVPMLNMLCAS